MLKLISLIESDDLETEHFSVTGHAVKLVQGSLLAKTLGTDRLESVRSFHGQAVDRPGEGIVVTAKRGGVSEAIEVGIEVGTAVGTADREHRARPA